MKHCDRCGKKLGENDWDIHTCTPKQVADDVEQSSTESKETFDQPVGFKITGKLGDICSFHGGTNVKKGDLVYTQPQPAAQWVGLTDEERQEVFYDCGVGEEYDIPACQDELRYARAIEAKLKEKNSAT